MKIEDMMMGFVDYNDRSYPFLYKNGILQLMPSSEEIWKNDRRELLRNLGSMSWKNLNKAEWIGCTYVSGRIHTGDKIVFCVSNSMSNNNGFISMDVVYIFQHREDYINPNAIQGFLLTGREINDFYTPAKIFNTDMLIDNEENVARV